MDIGPPKKKDQKGMAPKKRITKETILSTNDDFLWLANITGKYILFGVISGNINPPGGCRGQIPGFGKPRIQQKIEFENGLVCFFKGF